MILIFIGPALILYIAVMLFPILDSIYISFFKWDILGSMQFTGLKNYIRMFTTDDMVLKTLKNTVVILIFSLVGEQVFGFLIASALSGDVKFKNVFRNIYFLPAVISSAAIGGMWRFIYNPRVGLINSVLRTIGLDSLTQQWLTDEKIAMVAIAVVVVWQYTGYSMTLFMSAIQGIPQSLFDSAKIDGASHSQVMRHITLPLIRPIIKVSTILIAVGSLKFFDLVYVMTPGGGPNHATDVLASYIYRRAFTNFDYGYGDALSVLLMALCLIITWIINRSFKNTTYEY